jgi:hypothetical protein
MDLGDPGTYLPVIGHLQASEKLNLKKIKTKTFPVSFPFIIELLEFYFHKNIFSKSGQIP